MCTRHLHAPSVTHLSGHLALCPNKVFPLFFLVEMSAHSGRESWSQTAWVQSLAPARPPGDLG